MSRPCLAVWSRYNGSMNRTGRALPRPETTKKHKTKPTSKAIEMVDVNGRKRAVKSIEPDPTYPGFMKITYPNHIEWYSVQEFLISNPSLKSYAAGAPQIPEDEVGIVTSAGSDYVRDSSKNWQENLYAGFYVWIARGKGEGQKRTVLKNTHNKLVVDKPWKTPPDKTSQYVLTYNVHNLRAMGNTLPAVDVKSLERIAIERDKSAGRFSPERAARIVKYLDKDEV
jgi:hypothetical protein